MLIDLTQQTGKVVFAEIFWREELHQCLTEIGKDTVPANIAIIGLSVALMLSWRALVIAV